MSYIIPISILLFWAICAALSYATDFAYFQRKFPEIAKRDYKIDRRNAIVFSILGPIALAANFQAFDKFKHGLKWK